MTDLPPPVVVNVTAGIIVRPGDTLVVSTDEQLDLATTMLVRSTLKSKMPGLADVIVIARPLLVTAIYRESGD